MPSVPPAPGPGPFRALERQRPPRPQTRRGSLPASHSPCNTPPSALFLWVAECGAGGRGRRGAANPTRASYLSASIRPTELGLLLGLRGWGGSHGLGSRLPPPRPEPPDPSVAPSWGAGTRGQAPRGREEAAPAGLGGAGRGRLLGPARRGLGSYSLWKDKGGRGRLGAPQPPSPGPGPELELVLDTLSGRWRGNPSELGRGASPSTSPPGEGANPASSAPGGSPCLPRCPQGPVRPQAALGSRVVGFLPSPSENRGANQAVGLPPAGVGADPAPPPSTRPYPTPPGARPAAGAARGLPDSLHVASAAAIQPLIER